MHNSMSGLPAYSEEGLFARDVFYASVANIHFFVEDEYQENLYETLFKRLFPRLKRFQVFPLAGKGNVLAHATSGFERPARVRRVYVLDKDFDDLLGQIVIQEDIFYLDDYCVETALLDEVAAVQVGVEERPQVRRTNVARRLAFDECMRHWLPRLDRLHRAFMIVQKFNLGIRNTDTPIEQFSIEGRPSELDDAKVDRYVMQVSDALMAMGVVSDHDEYIELARRSFGSKRLYLRHVNGKMLARLIYHRLRECDLSSNLRIDSLLMRCVSFSALNRMKEFKRKVNAFLSS